MTLDELALAQDARVVAVCAPPDQPEWARLLNELGFTLGEPVRVLHRASLGADRLVVRIGNSTFALRQAEARCVQVDLLAA
jgi:ferrous iron transport protein A